MSTYDFQVGALYFIFIGIPAIFVLGVVIYFISVAHAVRQRHKDDRHTIRKTRLIARHGSSHTETRVDRGSAVARAIVGGWAAGDLGAIVGAATAKTHTVVTGDEEFVFRVWWGDGTKTTERCRYNDYWFKRFIEKTETE